MKAAVRPKQRSRTAARTALRAVFARADGTILDVPDVSAAADGGYVARAQPEDFIPLPKGSLLLRLPGRAPLGFATGRERTVDEFDGQPVDAVACALPLGYTRLALPAYRERAGAPVLPLYGYTAVAWADDGFRAAAIHTDELESWSPRSHTMQKVREGIGLRSLEFPGNALIAQLATCATDYGCYTAQNVFVRQGEAALPVSPACNARCIGCISAQEPGAQIKSAQERLARTPSVDEISAVAIAHLSSVPLGLVSFGQGCEGEPLMAAPLIEQAILRIRRNVASGTIHCNTNASRPKALERLIKAGLQSIRVSLNSARPDVYAAYYRPRGYQFENVVRSLAVAAQHRISISLNLLTHPGVTDDPREMRALGQILRDYPIAMLQTRTLNVDPARYFAAVGRPNHPCMGMRSWLMRLAQDFPNLRIGNFTRGFG